MAATAAIAGGTTVALYKEFGMRYPEDVLSEDDAMRIIKQFAETAELELPLLPEVQRMPSFGHWDVGARLKYIC